MSMLDEARAVRATVQSLGCDIYESLADHPQAVYSTDQLSAILREALVGRVFDAPPKTRSKLVKQAIASALGYPVPDRLRRVKPHFPGQDFEVRSQQRDNLQIWNDDVSPTRRYVFVPLDAGNRVVAVRVLEGVEVATFDKTGTLTSKYQATRLSGRTSSALVSASDTEVFINELRPVEDLAATVLRRMRPTDAPVPGRVLGVAGLHDRLLGLLGRELRYFPSDRQRGEQLHRAACEALHLKGYADTGRFPDIPCQALEVKLHLSTTIDLGLVCPDSTEPAITLLAGLRYCDARYAVAYATRNGDTVRIEQIVTTTGASFFDEFRRFGGLVQNKKRQLRLPRWLLEPE